MPGVIQERERFIRITQEIQPELALEAEPIAEILGPVMERGNKYGPLSEPSFRRPS